jgi:hypothetical protein
MLWIAIGYSIQQPRAACAFSLGIAAQVAG